MKMSRVSSWSPWSTNFTGNFILKILNFILRSLLIDTICDFLTTFRKNTTKNTTTAGNFPSLIRFFLNKSYQLGHEYCIKSSPYSFRKILKKTLKITPLIRIHWSISGPKIYVSVYVSIYEIRRISRIRIFHNTGPYIISHFTNLNHGGEKPQIQVSKINQLYFELRGSKL